MASARISLLCCFAIYCLLQCSHGARPLSPFLEEKPLLFALMLTNQNNNAAAAAAAAAAGRTVAASIGINLICYGKFTAPQRAIVADFVASLSSPPKKAGGVRKHKHLSVSSWWNATGKHLRLTPGDQILDDSYSLGKSLADADIARLAARGAKRQAINVVLTSDDVAVGGFCTSRCGSHGLSPPSKSGRFAYVWVGNSAAQCPGRCAQPFHRPAPLVAPNGDVGVDGMVFHLASMLAATVTNPFGNGLDPATGASYNVIGAHGRKHLVPTMFNP